MYKLSTLFCLSFISTQIHLKCQINTYLHTTALRSLFCNSFFLFSLRKHIFLHTDKKNITFHVSQCSKRIPELLVRLLSISAHEGNFFLSGELGLNRAHSVLCVSYKTAGNQWLIQCKYSQIPIVCVMKSENDNIFLIAFFLFTFKTRVLYLV